jgi:hypothetical protein
MLYYAFSQGGGMSVNSEGPILVILAAGMGSRYGGLKQVDRIGAGGEAILDYSVFDALRSGFGKVVFIIRRDIEADFSDTVLSRMGSRVPFGIVFQEQDSFIPADIVSHVKNAGRTKPWGTVHALLCAASMIDAPFCVINADDFYGRDAYGVMAKYLSAQEGGGEGALVPYRLADTLSEIGTVTRGVCVVENGFLSGIEEMEALKRESNGIITNRFKDGTTREFNDDTPVSMNFWGFPNTILSHIRTYFEEFLAVRGKELTSECYLPLAVDSFIKNGVIKIRELETGVDWFGVTYKEDRAAAAQRISALTAKGVYPERLWE